MSQDKSQIYIGFELLTIARNSFFQDMIAEKVFDLELSILGCALWVYMDWDGKKVSVSRSVKLWPESVA